jgi:hypothetical protein
MYYGSWDIDDNLTFVVNTHDPTTGAATDADAVPAYRVYEDETAVAILTGNMALLDAGNTDGFYSEQIALTAANGFEAGKSYNIYISAAVGAVTGTISHTFQMRAEVNVASISDDTTAATNAESFFDGTGYAGTNNVIPTVTTVGTTTTNTDMRGTDNAALAATALTNVTWTDARAGNLDELGAANIPADVDAILLDTAEIGAAGVGLTAVPWNAAWDAEVQSEVDDALDTILADSIPADGTRPTFRQALYMVCQFLHERAVVGTTVTVRKVDGITALLTLTLDDASDPTSITRAT